MCTSLLQREVPCVFPWQLWSPGWHHAVSSDLVHWEHLPIALSPTEGGYDSYGTFTGGADAWNSCRLSGLRRDVLRAHSICRAAFTGLTTFSGYFAGPDPPKSRGARGDQTARVLSDQSRLRGAAARWRPARRLCAVRPRCARPSTVAHRVRLRQSPAENRSCRTASDYGIAAYLGTVTGLFNLTERDLNFGEAPIKKNAHQPIGRRTVGPAAERQDSAPQIRARLQPAPASPRPSHNFVDGCSGFKIFKYGGDRHPGILKYPCAAGLPGMLSTAGHWGQSRVAVGTICTPSFRLRQRGEEPHTHSIEGQYSGCCLRRLL